MIQDEIAVERLGEPRVDHLDRPTVSGQRAGGVERPSGDRTEPDEQDVGAVAEDLAATDRDGLRLDRRETEAWVARIMQGERPILAERGHQQRPELLLVLRAGDHEIRELALG